jgi:hypothetical protein
MTSRPLAGALRRLAPVRAHAQGDLLGEKPALTNLQLSDAIVLRTITLDPFNFYLLVFYRKNAKVSERKPLLLFRAPDGTAT